MTWTTKSLRDSRRPSFVYLISFVVSAGEFIRSFDINVMSGAILYLKNEFGLRPYEEGFAMSSAIIGCVAGAMLGGIACDWMGRKRTLFITVFLYGISVWGTATPVSMFEFNVYRIVGGIGVGFASVACPLYIAEIAPARIRGRLVMLVQFAMVFGLTSATITTYVMSVYGLSWRWMMASEGVPVLLMFMGLFLVPESPRWLEANHRREESLRVLTTLVGPDKAVGELQEIAESLSQETGSYRELLQPGVRRALVIAVALAVFSQLVGMTTLMYYAPVLFQKTGLEISSAIARLIILNVWNLLCTIVAFSLVDTLGRRPLLLCGLAGLTAGLALMGLVFHFRMSGLFVLLVFFVCIGAYILSIAPLTWVIVSEVFPSRVRGRAVAIATFGLWLTVYCVTQFFPPLVAHFEKLYGTAAGVFWMFAGAALSAFFFCWRWIPETKGRSLEEIGRSWRIPFTEPRNRAENPQEITISRPSVQRGGE